MAGVDFNRQLAATTLDEAVTFHEALAAFAQDRDVANAVGFAYTPSEAPWFRYEKGTWHTHGGDTIPASAFEVRAFTADAELRWWRTTGFDRGNAVLLTESGAEKNARQPLFRLAGQRSLLLWGTAVGPSSNGWANLAEGRIGDTLWIPAPGVSRGVQVRLHLVEYVSCDQHGNISFAEQRLVGLSAAEGK